MAQTPPYVPNNPLTLPANLQYRDSMGNLVSKQFPNDYVVTVATNANTLINEYNNVITVLNSQSSEITTLQTQVTDIITSGATAIPDVNGGCLSSPANQVQSINTVVAELVSNTCDYNTVLGTPSALTQAIINGNWSYLNTQAAFSQNSTMSALTGWITSPSTIADGFNNSLLAYLDARAGIAQALSTNLCAQNTIDFQAILPSFGTGFNLYFAGYTFIATGFTDTGSTVKIVDSNGNIAINSINLVTQSTINTPYNFATSGTTLQSVPSYTIYLNSNLTSASGTNCQKTIVKTVSSSSISPYIGFPKLVANNDLTAQTSGSTIVTYVPSVDTTFQYGTYINITAVSSLAINIYISFTNIEGTLYSTSILSAGSITFASSSVGNIRVKAGTAITIYSTLTGGGTMTYDTGASITQMT